MPHESSLNSRLLWYSTHLADSIHDRQVSVAPNSLCTTNRWLGCTNRASADILPFDCIYFTVHDKHARGSARRHTCAASGRMFTSREMTARYQKTTGSGGKEAVVISLLWENKRLIDFVMLSWSVSEYRSGIASLRIQGTLICDGISPQADMCPTSKGWPTVWVGCLKRDHYTTIRAATIDRKTINNFIYNCNFSKQKCQEIEIFSGLLSY